MKPTREVKLAAQIALEDHITYEQFGNSTPIDDMPAEWVDAMMAVSTAKKTVKDKIEAEQQEKQQKKAKEQRAKAKQKQGRKRK